MYRVVQKVRHDIYVIMLPVYACIIIVLDLLIVIISISLGIFGDQSCEFEKSRVEALVCAHDARSLLLASVAPLSYRILIC